MNTTQLPTQRFSSRVDNYVKYRPSYPLELFDHLAHQKILIPTSIIADIGSGTGLLTQLFLQRGNPVYGIEPNPDMRRAGETFLQNFKNFTSINAIAEATTLPDASVDLITAGQAFHWFNRPLARREFARILRPGGTVALIWNERITGSPFLTAYENLLHSYSPDYASVDHRRMTDDLLAEFFHPNPVTLATFKNRQQLDDQSLRGRVLSSSYAPLEGHPNHAPMLAALQTLFDTHQSNNLVTFEYTTQLYTAQFISSIARP